MADLSPIQLHTVFEIAAYALGTQVFLWQRRRLRLPALSDQDRTLSIVLGAALGAALGSKFVFWIEYPLAAFNNFPDWRHLLEGKSIVGGLLGGLIGVELAKKLTGVTTSNVQKGRCW